MKKLLLPVLLTLTILLSACNAAGESGNPTAAPTTAPTDAAAANGDQTAEIQPITSDENPCVPHNILDFILPEKVEGVPEVNPNEWIKGSPNAPISIIVYSDLLCSHCASTEKFFNQLLDLFPEDINIVLRHWVIFGGNDIVGAQAAEAAGLQGKFFEFADIMFENQAEWGSLDASALENWLITKAESIGLDSAKFKNDLFSPEIVQKINDAQTSGSKLGFSGTPTIIINGAKYEQSLDINAFSTVFRLLKSEGLLYNSCPKMVVEESKTYSATISTTKGDIVVDLFADKAPYTVNSFVFLAREGWYNNLPIINTDQFIFSGDPTDTTYGGPGYVYKDEIDSTLNFNDPGMLASFAVGAGLNGSSFIISKIALPDLSGRTIFGKVTAGLDVLNNLEIRDNPFNPVLDQVLSVTINGELPITGNDKPTNYSIPTQISNNDLPSVVKAGDLKLYISKITRDGVINVYKQDGTVDDREDDLKQLGLDWYFFRSQIVEYTVKGNTEKLNKAKSAFDRTNFWLDAYNDDDVQVMLSLIEEKGW